MDVRAYGIYRFGLIDKVFLPLSTRELSAYESVHVMLRSLEVCISFFLKKDSITLFTSNITNINIIMLINLILQQRLSNLTDYCSELKVKHAKLRRKRDYLYQEDNIVYTNNTPNTSPKKKLRLETNKLL